MAGASGQPQWTQPGERRRKVTIQQQSASSKTAMGFLSNSWSTVLTTWAKVTTRQMSTFAASGATLEPLAKAVYLLNIRYPPSTQITAGMRVQDGSATYQIQNVVDVNELHRELTLFCSQIPAPTAEEQ